MSEKTGRKECTGAWWGLIYAGPILAAREWEHVRCELQTRQGQPAVLRKLNHSAWPQGNSGPLKIQLWTLQAISLANGIRQAVTPRKGAMGCSPRSSPAARTSGGPGHPTGPEISLLLMGSMSAPKGAGEKNGEGG